MLHVKLGCDYINCPAVVIAHMYNPSGDVSLTFLKGNEGKKTRNAVEDASEGEGEIAIHINTSQLRRTYIDG